MKINSKRLQAIKDKIRNSNVKYFRIGDNDSLIRVDKEVVISMLFSAPMPNISSIDALLDNQDAIDYLRTGNLVFFSNPLDRENDLIDASKFTSEKKSVYIEYSHPDLAHSYSELIKE